MDNLDSEDEEDGFEIQGREQIHQLVQNVVFFPFLHHMGEEDYRILRGNSLFHTIDQITEADLMRSLHNEDNTQMEGPRIEGREDTSDEVSSGESILNWSSSFEQNENVTESYPGETRFSTTDSQSNISSSNFNVGMNSSVNNGSSTPEEEYASFGRFPEGEDTQNHETELESPLSESAFAGPSRLEHGVAENLADVPTNRGQRRARSRSPNYQRTRARVEDYPPQNTLNELLLRLHYHLSPEIFELPVVNEFEIFSRFRQRELLRRQMARFEFQNSPQFAAFGARNIFPTEMPSDIMGNNEFGGLRPESPDTPFNREARRDHPEELSPRDGIDNSTQLLSEIPDSTLTEREQEFENMFPQSEHPRVRSYPSTIRSPVHRHVNHYLNDTPFVRAPRTLRELLTAFGEWSNFWNSDSDSESSVFPSQYMAPGHSQFESSDSDDIYNGETDSNGSFGSYASDPTPHSSSFRYLYRPYSSITFNSNSSTENSETSSELLEGNNGGNSSSSSSSVAALEYPFRIPVTTDESESVFFYDVVQLFLVNEEEEVQSVGLTKQQIDNLTMRIFGENDESKSCTICITKFIEGDIIRVLPCCHEYHADCIDRWLADNVTCPICRYDVTDSGDRENSS
ncbi:E3 ubiquitin-protein ligase RLIM-like [Ochotona princeps]|uniref:E3 ubiquitin-protein ligase RLIM-like n=1 Tax=Ochotona princeps TaxID=9978 RepID=UPI002714C11A|nr:E3 ubiquitin-protein ligase RLIM-like [Ochotona princeps]